ncbi:hypothetical protein [Flavobacterium sp.]|uniref:hypothetical protein n=1 Tax=Flavobacterium sp. TaxID=239 RepID=UPI00261ED5DC|nr:hypothetical protein [Flavobacterium sp.]MDD3004760.1 hypothetical protein [Flavobacterium sp.]
MSAQKKPVKNVKKGDEPKAEKIVEQPKPIVETKNYTAFSESVQRLQAELQTVENNKTQISQTISVLQPGVVKLNTTFTTIKDGKSTSEVYEFNMADIDINTIRTFTNKDVIQVQLLVGKKQKLIKKTIENQKSSYLDEVLVYAKNIDNGRNLVDLFKSLVPISNEIIEKRLSLKTYEEHINWLESNVKEVNLTDKQYVQKLTVNSKYPGRLELTIDEVANQKTTNTINHFNLANLNINSIFSEIKGDVIIVNVETKRKLKSVKTFSSKEQKDYVNNFSIYCENVEKSRDLQKVLKSAIALSEDKIEGAIPKIKTVSEGIAIIDNYIKNVVINETTYNQSLSGDCVLAFNKKESTASKMTDEQFFFNLKDLGKNLVKYFTEGKSIKIELQTKAGNKYLKHIVNQEVKSYTNNFEMNFAEIEEAIIAEKVLEQLIELCENTELKLAGSKKDLLLQLKDNIKKVEINRMAFEQSLEVKEETAVQFKTTEITEKVSKTKLYEFNLSDINPATVQINTSSANVFVTVNTNYMEKIIKYYEDSAIKNYQNTFNIYTSNIEEARTIVELFKKILQK